MKHSKNSYELGFRLGLQDRSCPISRSITLNNALNEMRYSKAFVNGYLAGLKWTH